MTPAVQTSIGIVRETPSFRQMGIKKRVEVAIYYINLKSVFIC